MARVKEIHTTVRRTIKLGSFDMATVEFGETVELEPGDDAQAERSKSYRNLIEYAGRKVSEIYERDRRR